MVFGGLSPHLPFEIMDQPVAPASSGAQYGAWPRSTWYKSVEPDRKDPLEFTASKAGEARHMSYEGSPSAS